MQKWQKHTITKTLMRFKMKTENMFQILFQNIYKKEAIIVSK